MVLNGVGYSPDKEFARRRIASYSEHGVEFRREHALRRAEPGVREDADGGAT